ncbi:MAG: discoidin domain-containing protein, partial [Oscillospiraceae bacterium]|nr:discoidin domain-containing protein [Oscillospiraceae bacterium]
MNSRICKRAGALLLCVALCVSLCVSLGAAAQAVTLDKSFQFYMVPNSHLDTSWQWPFQYTAENLLRTMYYNFTRSLDGNENYVFSTSASQHYKWAKDYYNENYYSSSTSNNDTHYRQIWDRIQKLVANGQLDITGGQTVEPDTNSPSGEAQVRSVLIADHFFEEEFGADKIPITGFLPDCFGFTGQYPQILLKSGMKYFVTSKLNWNDTNRNRDSDLFYWRALDGKSKVISYVLYKDYPSTDWNASSVQTAFDRNWQSGKSTNVKRAMGFFGSGDSGGGLPYSANPSGGNSYAAPATLNNSSAATVKMATCTQYFQDVEADIAAGTNGEALRYVDGEMYLEYHRGTYTSWSRMKRYNRKTEIMAEVAEKAATAAYYTGAVAGNSADKVMYAWDKVTINQMHDVLPGSAAPYQYYVAFNDHELAQNLLTSVQRNALVALAYRADTQVSGKPVFVYNPLSWERSGEVSAVLHYDGALPAGGIVLYDGDKAIFPSGIARNEAQGTLTVTFVASAVPAIGYKVFNAVESDAPAPASDLKVNGWVFENDFLKMTINPETGYISSLVNKKNGVESFAQGVGTEGGELHVYNDTGGSSWPAWDLIDSQVNKEPDTILDEAPISLEIIENNTEKVTIKVVKGYDQAIVTQYYTLRAGEDSVEVKLAADWFESNRLLKVSFPINASAEMATYETAYGSLQRPTTRDTSFSRARFEVPGHKYLDITDESGAYGVSVMNDAKYGFDSLKKTVNGTTFVRSRISVVRTPQSGPLSASAYGPSPATIDSGPMEFVYSIYPHAGSWEDAKSVNKGFELNYPLTAIEAQKNEGVLGSAKSFASSDKSNAIITVFKNQNDKPDDPNTVILRLYESSGRDTEGVTVTLPGHVLTAKEVNMIEHDYDPAYMAAYGVGGKAIAIDGDKITFDLGKYEILTIELTLAPAGLAPMPEIKQEAVALPYDLQGTSPNANRRAGFFQGSGTATSPGLSMPDNNWASEIDYQGIKFDLAEADEKNLVSATGQTIDAGAADYSKLFLVGAAAGTSAVSGDFRVNYASEAYLQNGKSVPLGEAAGKTVDVWYDYLADTDEECRVIVAAYDAEGRLSAVETTTAAPSQGELRGVVPAVDIPAETAVANLFVWDPATHVPVDLEKISQTETIRFDGWLTDLSGWNKDAWIDTKPYVYDTIVHVNDHYHSSTGTNNSTEAMTVDNYLFAYSIGLTPDRVVESVTLPDQSGIKIAAMTLAGSDVEDFGWVYDSSNELVQEPPATPQNVSATPVYNATQQGADILVTWDGDPDVMKYMVYASTDPNFEPSSTTLVSNQGSSPSYMHHTYGKLETAGPVVYYYRVVAIGRNTLTSAASARSNGAEITYINYTWSVGTSTARVNAGAQQSGEQAYKAIDQNLWTSTSDKWCCTSVGSNGWLRVDLTGRAGETVSLNRFILVNCNILEGYGNTRDYRIYYSTMDDPGAGTKNPGGNWSLAVQVTGNTDTIRTHDLAAPIEARWVMLVIDAGDGGSSGTVRQYGFFALGKPNYAAVSSALNPSVAASATPDGATLEAGYEYYNADGKTEGATQFKWVKTVNGVETAIPGAVGKTLSQTTAELAAASSYKVQITVYDDDGAQGGTANASLSTYTNVMVGAAVLNQTTANGSAASLVDGNTGTKWDAPTNAAYSGYQGPLPHIATLDMGAAKTVRNI